MMSKLCANFSSIENNFSYSLFSIYQDSMVVDSNKAFSMNNINKSPIKAMIYSSIFPGMGQAYLGKWKRALFFLAIEGVAASIHYQNNLFANKKKEEYISYANDHWNFNRWIHDYYYWHEEGDEQWNEIREVFINTEDDYYFDIWDHSHSVKFRYDGDIISSSNEGQFKEVYQTLCGISADLILDYTEESRECNVAFADISEALDAADAKLILDHHFYEGIQKYSMYFAGWDDALVDAVVSETNNNNSLITSPQQTSYQDNWSAYNEFKIKSERVGSYMIINHFVSMIDVLILSKISKTKYLMNLDLVINMERVFHPGGLMSKRN